jgi:hypothetical protein
MADVFEFPVFEIADGADALVFLEKAGLDEFVSAVYFVFPFSVVGFELPAFDAAVFVGDDVRTFFFSANVRRVQYFFRSFVSEGSVFDASIVYVALDFPVCRVYDRATANFSLFVIVDFHPVSLDLNLRTAALARLELLKDERTLSIDRQLGAVELSVHVASRHDSVFVDRDLCTLGRSVSVVLRQSFGFKTVVADLFSVEERAEDLAELVERVVVWPAKKINGFHFLEPDLGYIKIDISSNRIWDT